jgi:uncharacterized SAM-binding protein YcdF (DUF218 family)
MSKINNLNIPESINTITRFLAKRDIQELTPSALSEKFGIRQADVIILLGNSIPDIGIEAARAFKSGLAKSFMIAGGIGHSTKYLIDHVNNFKEYQSVDVDGKSEAEILKEIIVRKASIHPRDIIIETKSLNCGSNAYESLKVLKGMNKVPSSILLFQDPTMQFRSHASFEKAWENENTLIISYAPFIPQVKILQGKIQYMNDGINGLWNIERLIDLIMGEIPRLKDDTNGYGPNGKGFIAHVDIPVNVLSAYELLLSEYAEYKSINNRK